MNVRSMTGFGRGEGSSSGLGFTVEVRSVNHRHLDIKTRLPKYLMGFEPKIKSLIKPYAKRGRIDVSLTLVENDGANEVGVLDTEAAALHLGYHQTLSDKLGVDLDCTSRDLIRAPGVLKQISPQNLQELAHADVAEVLQIAFEKLLQMRTTEGKHLHVAMIEILSQAEAFLGNIQSLAVEQTATNRERLIKRLGDLMDTTSSEQEARIMLEAGLIAERLDIQEELDRLQAHFEQFRSICDAAVIEPIGRRLDFLCQEMGREINTIASKAQSLEITRSTIELKTLMERIREQVQNVE